MGQNGYGRTMTHLVNVSWIVSCSMNLLVFDEMSSSQEVSPKIAYDDLGQNGYGCTHDAHNMPITFALPRHFVLHSQYWFVFIVTI